MYVNAALMPKNASETLFTVNFTVKADATLGSTGSFTVSSEGAYSTAAQLVTGTGVTDKTFTVTVQESTGLLGDVNGDGEIDSRDATLILRYAVGLTEFSNDQFLLADVTKDGEVDSRDATMILRYAVGLITEF